MSHYRNLGGGRRDKNEPEIMQRFRYHGWHPEQVSGNRLWDLNVYPPRQPHERVAGAATLVFHVDVKGPKGKVEDAQREKWKALAEKGIPVYVCRTEADVDTLVRGELEPWRLETTERDVLTALKKAVLPQRSGPRRAKVREVLARSSVEARDEARRRKPECDCGYIVGRLKTNGGHKDTCATRADPANADAALADVARRYTEREDTLIAKRAAAELKRRGLTRTQPVDASIACMGRAGCERATTGDRRVSCSCRALDAAKEAAETFAPDVGSEAWSRGETFAPPTYNNRVCEVHACYEPPVNGRFCAEHTP